MFSSVSPGEMGFQGFPRCSPIPLVIFRCPIKRNGIHLLADLIWKFGNLDDEAAAPKPDEAAEIKEAKESGLLT